MLCFVYANEKFYFISAQQRREGFENPDDFRNIRSHFGIRGIPLQLEGDELIRGEFQGWLLSAVYGATSFQALKASIPQEELEALMDWDSRRS